MNRWLAVLALGVVMALPGVAGAERQTAMVVSEDPTLRGQLRVYLTNLKMQVLEADDSARAQQMLTTVPVSVVVTAKKLKSGDGLELARKVRTAARADVRGVPIVMVLDAADAADEATQAGATAIVRKPIEHAKLVQAIQQATQGK